MDLQCNQNEQQNPRRKVLVNCVALLAQEAGYQQMDKAALGTLVEALQSQLASRVEPTVGDVTLAMTELGLKIDPVSLRGFFKRHNRPIIPNCQPLPPPKTPSILSSGKRPPLPSYVPDHFPPMPDPHCYIRTPTHKQPLTDYAACREKTSQTKRDLERSLTKFYARTTACDYIFYESNLFPLITPRPVTYLDPLVQRDQIFDEDDQSLPPLNHIRKERPVDQTPRLMDGDEDNRSQEFGVSKSDRNKSYSWELIDNPFLRPAKVNSKDKK